MLRSVRQHLTYANVIATLALSLALGGGAYAAATLPRHSVGTKQLRKAAVTGKKLHRNAVTSSKVKNGSLKAADFAAGQLPAGAQGPKGDQGDRGDTGPQGPAGTARAYAHVTRGTGGSVLLDPDRSFNATAELPSTGNTDRPCVTLPSSIDATKVAAVATVDSQNTPNFWTAVASVRVGGEGSQGCPPNSVAIFVRRNDGNGGDDIAFNVIVP